MKPKEQYIAHGFNGEKTIHDTFEAADANVWYDKETGEKGKVEHVIEYKAYAEVVEKLARAREYHQKYLETQYGEDTGEQIQAYDEYVEGEV